MKNLFRNLFLLLMLLIFTKCTEEKIIIEKGECNCDDTDLKTGLVAYYPFNGNANDSSGKGNHGIVYGPILTSDRKGNENNAYYFDGNNSYIDIGNSNLIKRNACDYTLSFWLKLNEHSINYCSIILSNRNKTNGYGSMIEIAGELSAQYKQVIFYKNYSLSSDTFTAGFVNSIDDLEINEWYHVCMTYKYKGGYDNIVNVYIDGILTSSMPISGANDPGDGKTFIGCEPELAPVSYSYNGCLDEIRIYNRVLTDLEIRKLYLDY